MKKTLAAFFILSVLVLPGCVVGLGSIQPTHTGYYGHPSMVVIPGTYVYAMTDVADDTYFHVGWWWRLRDGRWYTSRHHDRGWSHYRGVPAFYREVDPRWRDYYRHRNWHGHPWACERIPASRVQQDWHRWQDTRHWERERNWGVQGFRPTPYRQSGLAERTRDGSRIRESERPQFGPEAASDRGRELTHGNATPRPGQPHFATRRTDGRETQGFQGNRARESRNARPQPAFARQERQVETPVAGKDERRDERRHSRNRPQGLDRQPENGDGIEAPLDRERQGQQGSRRNLPLLGQGRTAHGTTDQPRQDRVRADRTKDAATPIFQERRLETGSERQQRGRSDLRQSRPASLQREASQEHPQHQERRRDARKNRRPAQQLPGQGNAVSGAPSVDTAGTTQAQ